MSDAPYTYASYYEGYEAFRQGNPTCPYPRSDENYGPWCDGWYEAFDDSVTKGRGK